MAQSVGSLQVDLTANTAAFQADMGKAAAAVRSSTSQMAVSLEGIRGAFETVERAAALLGVGVGVAEVVSFAKEAASSAADLKDMAVQVGVSTDALQAYSFAAATAGIGQDQLTVGLQHLSRVIGEAAQGNNVALDTFNRLGVGILGANGQARSTEAIMQDVAASIGKIPDPATRALVAFELFGRSGQQMLSLFAEGLDNVRANALDAGVIIPEETINRLKEAADAAEIFWMRLKAGAAEAIAAVLEFKDKFEQTLAAAQKDVPQEAAGAPQFYGEFPVPPPPSATAAHAAASGEAYFGALPPAPPGIGSTGEALPLPPPARPDAGAAGHNPLSENDQRLAQMNQQLLDQLAAQRDGLGKTADEQLKLKLASEQYIVTTLTGAKTVQKYTDSTIASAVAIQQEITAKKDAIATQDALAQRQNDTFKYQEKFQQQVDDLKAQAEAARQNRVEWDALSSSYEVNAHALAVVQKQQEIVNQNLNITDDEALKMAQDFVAADEALKKAQESAQRDLQRTHSTVSELDSFTQGAFDHIGQAIANAYIQGGQAAVDFGQIGKTVIAELEQEFIKLAAINPLKNALFGSNSPTISDVGGILGNLFNGSSSDAALASEANAASLAGDMSLAGFAGGTPDAPAGPAWVGENGPEILNFAGGETVTPTDQIGLGLGGGVSIQVIDQRGSGQPVDVQQQRRGDGTTLVRMTIRDETNRAMQAGVLDRSMRSSYGIAREPVLRG